MGEKQALSVKVDKGGPLHTEVERYAEQCESKSAALKDLLRVGIREKHNPLVYRFKDSVINWAGQLGVIAVFVFVLGSVTPFVAFGNAVLVAFALVIAALLLMAMFEVIRFLTGSNEVGQRIREVVAR
jgi:hypothetical protein